MDNLTSIHNDFYGFELTYTLIIHVYITHIQYYLVSINYVITIIFFFLQFFCVNKSRCHNKEKKMTRFPMLDPPFQVQSKKTRFYAKIFVQFGRSNRPLLTKSACMFYQKDDEKKINKKMSTH